MQTEQNEFRLRDRLVQRYCKKTILVRIEKTLKTSLTLLSYEEVFLRLVI
mgnify:CR=1 FL=1